MRRSPRVVLSAALVIASLSTTLAGAAHGSAAAAPKPPSKDSFYRYSGQQPLSSYRPGTVLKKRTIQLAFGPVNTPVTAEQLLYRTTDQLGHPTATVTTVIAPSPLPAVPDIVGYLSFYDDLGGKCDPSYTLAGGNPGASNQSEAEEEELLINFYVENGWIVTIPDFEGPHLHWMAGRQSGYGTLDALRATESALALGTTTPIGLSGYSGGAVAANWAAELGPRYAPKLNLVGVAMGGIPVDYANMFRYINGTKTFSAAIPGMLIGLARAYHLNLHRYLSPYGRKVVHAERNVCIGSVFGHYPGLTYQKLLKPRYQHIFRVHALARLLNRQRMGLVRGHPHTAFLMGNGDIDGYGDGVMSVRDVIGLAQTYCAEGDPVEYHRYGGAGHEAAGAYFEPETAPFLQARFEGLPFKGNCTQARATG
ncbi:MAG: lipase family protein [Mycobacteriales bacterium]